MGCVVPQYRCYKTYSAAVMKCGSRLLKSKLFKVALLYGIKSLASVSAPFKGGYSPSLLSSGSWNADLILDWYSTLRSFHYSLYVRCILSWDVHWARLEASALGSLIAACPSWKRREEKRREEKRGVFIATQLNSTRRRVEFS